MGCACSKPAEAELDLNESLRAMGATRHNFVWVREDVNMTDVYDVIKVVGQGSMGEVSIVTKKHLATEKIADRVAKSNTGQDMQSLLNNETTEIVPKDDKHTKKTNRKYACKTINTVRFNDQEIAEFINEINILRELDHPNIIQLFEVFRKKRKMWIIMELCTGGDLTKRINSMTEMNVAIVMKQIMQAIAYMHNHNVCHRDIKLENILYADSSPDAPVMLIDFGLSNTFTKDTMMKKACGTIYTAAPEIILGLEYREETDIWSIGCVAFLLLSGDYPFLTHMSDLRDAERMDNLKNGRFTFGPTWQERNRSQYGKDFCTGCLQKDPAKRRTAKQALEFVKDVWIPHLEILDETCLSSVPDTIQEGQDEPATSPTTQRRNKRTRMDTEMIKGMGKFVLYGELKKTILLTMAYTMDKSSLHELREIFTNLDSTGSGTVSLVDLKIALERMHSDKQLEDETIEKLFHGIDVDESGQIHYNEFLAAVVESQGLITMEHLADAFDRLDGDEKGYLSKDDLKKLLGTDYNEEKVNRMIDEADYDKNGQIDYEEFLRLMFEDPTSGLDVLGSNIVSASDREMLEKLVPLEPSRAIPDLNNKS